MRKLVCSAVFLSVCVALVAAAGKTQQTPPQQKGYHPCCSFPCQNRGICSSRGFVDYECDCTNTQHYGRNCEHASLIQSIKDFLRPSPITLQRALVNYKWLWQFLNSWTYVHSWLIKMVYVIRGSRIDIPPMFTSAHEYVTLESAYNHSYFARALPPIHKNCPTPMGVAGKKVLPEARDVVARLFKRDVFKPDPLNHNVHIPFFAQHFTHQFFKTSFRKGPAFQWGGHGVDVSHVYGKNKHTENLLRSFENGRLKSQIIKDEEYPPYNKDVPVYMSYPPNTTEPQKFALGHEFYGLLPGLFLYSTIWLREHNRIVAVLAKEHPDWEDEQLFQTAKLIVTGETIQIVISDYVQHLSNYHIKVTFEPEVLFGTAYQYQNRIAVEFNHLYHWHPMMPDELHIGGVTYKMDELMFHPEIVVKHGVAAVAEAFTNQLSGAMTTHNHGNVTHRVVTRLIEDGRAIRLQPFNQYRKRFGFQPYTSFIELTGDEKTAAILEDMYGDVDAVEFYVGLVVEKRPYKAKFGLTLLEIGASNSVTGLLSNPICSPDYWKPSTFGGNVGFDMIKTARLEKLFCDNIKGKCPKISFEVPQEVLDAQNEKSCVDGKCEKTEL